MAIHNLLLAKKELSLFFHTWKLFPDGHGLHGCFTEWKNEERTRMTDMWRRTGRARMNSLIFLWVHLVQYQKKNCFRLLVYEHKTESTAQGYSCSRAMARGEGRRARCPQNPTSSGVFSYSLAATRRTHRQNWPNIICLL